MYHRYITKIYFHYKICFSLKAGDFASLLPVGLRYRSARVGPCLASAQVVGLSIYSFEFCSGLVAELNLSGIVGALTTTKGAGRDILFCVTLGVRAGNAV